MIVEVIDKQTGKTLHVLWNILTIDNSWDSDFIYMKDKEGEIYTYGVSFVLKISLI